VKRSPEFTRHKDRIASLGPGTQRTFPLRDRPQCRYRNQDSIRVRRRFAARDADIEAGSQCIQPPVHRLDVLGLKIAR